ncbi:MAG: response regulator [candidate division Zixibacteria bacterium]|nr:response regulator [candidate division Zixibacteria bacterium]
MDKKKILLADDEPDIIRTVGRRLKSAGYDVLTAMDGFQATSMAIQEEPDVIILDIGMPAGDGHAVADRLRSSAKTCNIPIVFLTARTSEEDQKKAFDAGAVHYITNPFDAEELLICIDGLFSGTYEGT